MTCYHPKVKTLGSPARNLIAVSVLVYALINDEF